MKKVLSTVHFYVPCLLVVLAALAFVTSTGCNPEKKQGGEVSSPDTPDAKSDADGSVKTDAAEDAKSDADDDADADLIVKPVVKPGVKMDADDDPTFDPAILVFEATPFDEDADEDADEVTDAGAAVKPAAKKPAAKPAAKPAVEEDDEDVVESTSTALFTRPRAAAKPVLYFYTWADYIDPDLVKKFEQKFNCTVKQDYFESNEAMLAKLQSGNVGYDLVLPSTYMVDIMLQGKLLQLLDAKKIPNAVKYVDPVVAKKLKDEKMANSVPYMIGFTGIGYNAKAVGSAPESWDIFADKKFKNRMTMLDDMRETIGVALLCCGYDPNTTNDKEIAEARDLIISWKANLAKFGVDDAKHGLENGEFYVVHAYSGDIMQMMMEDENIQFAMPEGKSMIAADHFVIPKNAKNAELAHEFINFFCDPKIAAQNMEYTCFRAPIPEAMKLVNEELRESPSFALSGKGIENAPMVEDVGEALPKYSKAWDEIKAAK